MKIKLFSGRYPETVENNVNDFLQSVDVIDIKFSSTSEFDDVMVIYNELPENENT